jgi:transcriptional regulator with XRE-family HTH domain
MAVNSLHQAVSAALARAGADGARRAVPLIPTVPTLDAVLTEEDRKARLAYWIRDIRFRRGLTPPKLAERIGVSRSTINKWEAGEQVPSMIWLGPLAAALSVDPRLFADLPAIPPSTVADYLVDDDAAGTEAARVRYGALVADAAASALEGLEAEQEGHRAAATRRVARRGKRPA